MLRRAPAIVGLGETATARVGYRLDHESIRKTSATASGVTTPTAKATAMPRRLSMVAPCAVEFRISPPDRGLGHYGDTGGASH